LTERRIGFGTGARPDAAAGTSAAGAGPEYREALLAGARAFLKPEFLNRLDAVIVFNPLRREDLLKIVDLRLGELAARVRSTHGIEVRFDAGLRQFLVAQGFSPEYGARELRRVIQRAVADPLAEYLLARQHRGASTGGTILVKAAGSGVEIEEVAD